MRVSILILLVFCQNPALADEIPVGSPVSEPTFNIARELYGRGKLEYFEYSRLSPLPDSTASQSDLTSLYYHSGFWPRTPVNCVAAGLILQENNYQRTSNINYLKLYPYLRIKFSEKLSSSILYRIDGELDNDSRYSGKSWNGVAGFPELATLDYEADGFHAMFGIERLSWGFANCSNLMFSKSAMPIPQFSFSYRRSFFDFESVTGFLDPLDDQLSQMEHDTSFFTSQQRYISAHSISLKLFSGFSLSLREAVLYGGPGRRLEAAYLFPFIWYHGQQLNSRMNDNTIASIGADYRYDGKAWLYGELLIDDYQAEKKTRGDYEPNELGYLAGFELYDFFMDRSTLALEYSRANNWTFNQSRVHNRYINDNYPIGYVDGPDSDILSWRASWWLTGGLRLSYTGSYRRHGEGRIDSPWTRPWLETDNYSEQFPTGIVERQSKNGLKILTFNKNWLWSNIGLDFTDISNVENIPGRDCRNWDFLIEIGIKIPPFIWGF